MFKYTQRIKRLADALEKLGVAAWAVGIFQGSWLGVAVGICAISISLKMTPKE